ncbi:MAG: TrmH family RNA methyltransferase, partial [Erythrobacter sp.]|nr:TrmH family RNA methyltransferase [Erythrobacter sp.]
GAGGLRGERGGGGVGGGVGGGGGGGGGGGRRGRGQLVAASLREAVPYRGAAYTAPCFILVGNESQGLPEAYEAQCDLRVTMPMRGRADSLNAAVAGAVLAYEVLAGLETRADG